MTRFPLFISFSTSSHAFVETKQESSCSHWSITGDSGNRKQVRTINGYIIEDNPDLAHKYQAYKHLYPRFIQLTSRCFGRTKMINDGN